MRRHHIWLGFLFLAIASCSDPHEARRQFLLTEMKQLEQNYSLIAQEIASKQQQVSVLQKKLRQQRSELAEYNRQVKVYISNNKMAVAALAAGVGGAAVAYDPNNEFLEEVRGVATLFGIIAVIYALGNLEEISQVADQLWRADLHVKSLKEQIENTQSELNSTLERINQLQTSVNSMQTIYNSHKTELESLR